MWVLGSVEGAWPKCLLRGRCVKSIQQIGAYIIFGAFMDLEKKAYDTIHHRHGMWQMLRVYGVRVK